MQYASYDQGEFMDIDSEAAVNEITHQVSIARGHQQGEYTISTSNSNMYTKQMIYLVVDTNFIISHLQIIDNLVQLWGSYHQLYQIVIPRQVIHELDGLKDSSTEGKHSIANLARRAIDWCYSHFHDISPQVRGQKMLERVDDSASKDNSILDCCIFFKFVENGGGSMVVLLSNDKNLCTKALINNILTVSFRNDMNANLIAEKAITELMAGLQDHNHQQSRGNLIEVQQLQQDVVGIPENNYTQHNLNNNYDDDMMIIEDNQHETNTKLDIDQVCNKMYEEATVLVKDAITFAVGHIFEDQSHLSGYDPSQITTLTDACYCIQKMYISTFSDFFQRGGRGASFNPSRYLKSRSQIRSIASKPVSVGDLIEFESFWSQFLLGIYMERTIDERKALKQIISNWKEMIDAI